MASIAGFLVVRLPEKNCDEQGAFAQFPPRLGDLYYGGIFRMPWFDIEDEYYTKTLDSWAAEKWNYLKATNQDFCGFEICRDLKVAKRLLDYSNRKGVSNELIAVRSTLLSQVKGSMELDESFVDWLGRDIVSLGHWSLLRDGLFLAPSYFSKWNEFVTDAGLLNDSVFIEAYVEDYQRAAVKDAVEELPPAVYGIDAIEVGRIRGQ